MPFQVNLTVNNKTSYKITLYSKNNKKYLAALLPVSIIQLNFKSEDEIELLYSNNFNEDLGKGILKFGESIGLYVDKGNITSIGYKPLKLTVSANTVSFTQEDASPLNVLNSSEFADGGNVTLILENIE